MRAETGEIFPGRNEATGGKKPVLRCCEEDQEQRRGDEFRQRRAEIAEQAEAKIHSRAALQRGERAERDGGDGDGNQRRRPQHGGVDEGLADDLGHRQGKTQRGAEVAVKNTGDPAQILSIPGLIEMQLLFECGDCFRGGVFPQNHDRCIARQHRRDGEHGEGDDRQHEKDGQQAAEKISPGHADQALFSQTFSA
ncbi:hypothetical protein D3C80_871510 [compost metagenome]